MDDSILIPTYISKYGCYSSACILGGSIFASIYKYYTVAILAFFQAIVSYMNWKVVKKSSWIKTIDIIFAVFIVLYITFVDSNAFRSKYQKLWYCTVILIVFVFITNELLLYYQVKTPTYDKQITSQSIHYFSLNYTLPGTSQREYAYYRSTFTHIMFIHLLPVAIVAFCVYKSNPYPF